MDKIEKCYKCGSACAPDRSDGSLSGYKEHHTDGIVDPACAECQEKAVFICGDCRRLDPIGSLRKMREVTSVG